MPRGPDVAFRRMLSRRNREGKRVETYLARCSIPVVWPDDTEPQAEELREYLDTESERVLRRLKEISGEIGARRARRHCDEEISYVEFELGLPDQPILDAETFVDEVESALFQGADRRLLFVCHASEDGDFVDKLVEALDGRALHAWYDRREIIVGDSIVEKINQGLADARYLLVVLSPRSVEKPWVKRELNAALMRQLSSAAVRVIPLLLEDCKIPPLLADIKYADFRTSFDQGLSQLLPSVRAARR